MLLKNIYKMNCPVCDKSGLPDYNLNSVVCPQCNSDLSGFVQLEKSSIVYNKSVKRQKRLVVISVIVALVLILLLFMPRSKKQAEIIQAELQQKETIINKLSSELSNKDEEIQILKRTNQETEEINFYYVVKKGDNLSKIAYLFYNDWEMYKKIQRDNNLKPGDLIMPKDKLIIKIKQ
jgi:uncharacterized membrane protein YvbJ